MRNYNKEIKDTSSHKYTYDFDKIMHGFIYRTFKQYSIYGHILELGSFKGDFTKHILNDKCSSYLTCIEASKKAIEEAKKNINLKGNPNINFVNSTFEYATLSCKYETVIMTHVLEHLDSPIEILRKINKKWLSENGRLFIAVPNANAPSRQIAVEMGLIDHNTAVTKDEKKHGHKRTYTLDTLKNDVRKAGLKIEASGGIFFKGLANFQFDKALQEKIITLEYLEGCYQLGKSYPDLCSSIYVVAGH